MKAIILLALIVLISCDSPDFTLSTFKCPDDKIKMGSDVCAINTHEKDTDGKYTELVTYIKNKCGKNKSCEKRESRYNINTNNQNDVVYACVKKLKYLKIKKKCNYHAECLTRYCNGGKCATLDTCQFDEDCGPGKFCDGYNSQKCYEYVKEGQTCNYSDKRCAPGLECYPDSKCTKLYSLENGAKVSDSSLCKLCKSGVCADIKAELVCAEIEKTEGNCVVSYNYGSGIVTVSSVTYKDSDGNDVCNMFKMSSDLVSDLKKRYDKIKLDKILEKEDCDYAYFLCDKKYAELYWKYENYKELLEQGLIKDNGKRNGDKKCEYEFAKSLISSSYINYCIGFAFALLSLLF